MMKQLLTILILVFGLSAANAATWYVATTGSDANSGNNLSDAKLTVNGAIAVASNGDVIRVANGIYAGAVAVTKRVTIVGESNHITTGTIFTNTITLIATGGSSSSRIILDNICARNSTVGGDNSASIVVRASFVTIQNCFISNTGLASFVATTAGPGAGIRFYSPSAAGVISDFIIRNNAFAYQAAGIVVSENVSINHGTSDQFIIEGNDFNEHTSNVIYFIETSSNVSADSGKVKNVTIKNNNLRNNRQTTSALGSSIPINLIKGTQDLLIENVGIYSFATGLTSRHQVQLRPQFQGATSNTSIKDLRLVRDADNNAFHVGLFIQPQNTGATYGSASTFSSLSNVTIDGLYARNYYTALNVDQYVDGPVTVKNSNNLRSTAEEASFIVQPGNALGSPMFGCPVTASPHIFDNNYTGSTNILGFKRVLSVTTGSNIGTVADPTCSRSNNTTSSSVLGKTAFAGVVPLGTCTTETASNYEFNANAAATITTEFQFYNSDADRTTSSYLINTFETATITNHQANSLNVTTSADVPVGSYTTVNNAIAAASAGNKIRGFEHGTTYSTFTVDKDLTFVISGSDRFDSPAKVSFENLTVNSGQTLTLKGDMWTTNNLTINGTLDLNGYALVVNGAIVYGGAGEIKGGTAGSSIFYNSASNSNLKMASGFASLDLLVMNGAGTLTLSNNVTVTQQVRTAAGTIALNGFTLTVEGSGINPAGGSIDASVASSTLAFNTAYPVSLANIVGSNLVVTRSIAGDVIAPGSSVFASINLLGGNYGLTSGSTLVLSESSNFSGIGTIYATGTSTLQVNYATTPGSTPNLFGFGTISFTGAASATLGAITAPGAGVTINFTGPGVLGNITGNVNAINATTGTGTGTVGNISGNVAAITHNGSINLTVGSIGGILPCSTLSLGSSRTGNTSIAAGSTINSLVGVATLTIQGTGTVNIGAFTLNTTATNFTISTTTGGNGGAVTLGNITSGSATIIPSFTSSTGAGPLTVGTITGNCGTVSSNASATSGSVTVGNISGNCGAITHRSGGILNIGTIGGTCAGIDLNSSNRSGSSTIGNITGNVVMTANINGNGSISIGNIRPSASVTLLPNVSANITIGNIDATNGAFGFTKSASTSGTVTIGNITAGNLGNIGNNGSTNMSIGNVASGNCGNVTNTSTGTLTIGTISGNCGNVATAVASSGLITIGNIGGTCGTIASGTSTHGSITMGTIGGACGVITHQSSGNITVGTIGGVLQNPSISASTRTGNTSIAANSTIASMPGAATLTISGTGTVNIGSFTLSSLATNFTISTTTGGNGGAVTFGNITSGSATIIPTFTKSANAGPLTVGNITGNCGNISVNTASSGGATIGNISGNCGTISHASTLPVTIGTIGGTCGAISYTATSTGNATIGTITGAVTSLTVNTAATTCSLSFTGAVTITGAAAFTSGRCVFPGTTTLNGNVTAGASGVIIGGDNTDMTLAGAMSANNTFPTTDPYVNNLTINKTGAFTFTLAGTLRVKNTLTLTAGTLTLNGNRLRVGNLAHTGGNILTTATADLYIFNAPSANYTIPFSNATPAFDTLSITPSSAGSFAYSFNNGLTALGTLINSSNLTMSAGTGFTTLANVNQSGGTLTTPTTLLATITNLNLSGGNFASGSALTTVTTLNQTGGVFNASTSLANMTTLGISAGTFNVGRTTGTTVAAAINHSGGTIAFAPNTFFLGAATYTPSGTPILDIKDADGILSTGTTNGNFRLSTTRTFSTAGTYNYTGSAPQVTGSGLPSSVAQLGIDNGTNVSLTNDVTVTSVFARTSGSLNLNDRRLTYSSNATTDLYLVGSAAAKLSLTGSTGNVALRFTTSGTLSDLVINRSGNPTIDFISGSLSPTVTGTMALTEGILTTTSAVLLNMADGATYTGGSNNSYISGPMRKTGDDAFVFPTGKTGRLSQIAISAPANVTSQFEAEYFASNSTITPDNLDMGTGLFSVSGKEYWNLNRTVGSDPVSVTLHWNANDLSIKSNLLDLRVAHYDGNEWNSEGGTTSGNLTTGTVTSSAPVTSFSPFTIGSENGSNPLPVTLTKFTGRNVNGQANLFWTTAAELNNSGFEIMKSTDGKNWSVIGFVKGVGTSNKVNNYAFTDANLVYNSFYKLRQVDFDGKTTDSKSITINANTTELSAVAYPNPFNNTLSLTIAANKTEKGKVTVYNVVGKVVSEMEVNLVNGANITELQLANLTAGVYTVRVNQTNEVATLKVVKK